MKSAGGIVCGGGTWLFKSHYAFPNHLSECSQSVCIVREDEQAVSMINPLERLRFEMEFYRHSSKNRDFRVSLINLTLYCMDL